jgi:hypothetical protein
VDQFSRARVGDFTFAMIDPGQGTLYGTPCSAMVQDNLPVRYTAPEVLKGKGSFSKVSDVFSFAMVMYEVSSVHATQKPSTDLIAVPTKVFAGEVPFKSLPTYTLAQKVMAGKRPERPTDLAGDVWDLMQKCWHQKPDLRPEMSKVLQGLTLSLFQTLHESVESLPELQVALSQFYDSTERGVCIDRLSDVELKKFVDFLDDVRLPFDPSYFNTVCDLSYRYYVSRNWVKN